MTKQLSFLKTTPFLSINIFHAQCGRPEFSCHPCSVATQFITRSQRNSANPRSKSSIFVTMKVVLQTRLSFYPLHLLPSYQLRNKYTSRYRLKVKARKREEVAINFPVYWCTFPKLVLARRKFSSSKGARITAPEFLDSQAAGIFVYRRSFVQRTASFVVSLASSSPSETICPRAPLSRVLPRLHEIYPATNSLQLFLSLLLPAKLLPESSFDSARTSSAFRPPLLPFDL